jgi:hypothetical protein
MITSLATSQNWRPRKCLGLDVANLFIFPEMEKKKPPKKSFLFIFWKEIRQIVQIIQKKKKRCS